jgi:hypothetical protein
MPSPFVAVGGAGEQITTMIATTFHVPAIWTVPVADGDGASGRVIDAVGYNRIFLANPGNGTSAELQAQDLLQRVQLGLNGLNSWWTVSLRSDGFVQIAYDQSPTPGDAVITWTGNADLRNLLGFEGSTLTLNSSNGRVGVATKHPQGVLYSSAVLESSDWQTTPQDTAFALTSGGRVYGWASARHLVRKRFTLGFLPRNWTVRGQLGAAGSPAWPEESTNALHNEWLAPSPIPDTKDILWTAHHTFNAMRTAPVAVLFGRFQQAATVMTYDLGYLTPESLMVDRPTTQTVPQWTARQSRQSVEMSRIGVGVRT